MARQKSKKSNKNIKRLVVFGFLCFAINGYLLYSLGTIWNQVYEKKEEKEQLAVQLTELQENEEALKVEVNKLQDPEYIAKYAREKYLYSGKDEYVLIIK